MSKAKGTSGEVTTTLTPQNCQAFWVSGAEGPASYLSMSRQKICTVIMLKLQQCPI